jgi:hypothetical protein
MFIVNGRVGNDKNIGRFTVLALKSPKRHIYLDVFEKDKYSCCNSLKASSDEYLVYSGGIYTTPKNTGWSVDDIDIITLPGYKFVMKNRKKITKNRSGGIMVGFKDNLAKHIGIVNTDSTYVMWLPLTINILFPLQKFNNRLPSLFLDLSILILLSGIFKSFSTVEKLSTKSVI